MIVIIDYQAGNIGSIQNMLKRIGVECVISSEASAIEQATKLILPGVGAFDYGMSQLNQSGLIDTLNDRVLVKKVPLLGICLGLQLITKKSEEGKLPGLGWIEADTIAFDRTRLSAREKVPHMGWNQVKLEKPSRLHQNQYEDERFYFVHSYHLVCRNPEDCLYTTNYGYDFTAGIEKENIVAVQFHPEKSHKFGMRLLENFVNYY